MCMAASLVIAGGWTGSRKSTTFK